ncbi:hypothetical protein MKW98_001830 [Papaver atlanticum]|uniref:Uncharacterized protein n=1 Tax=Papaver atlanticum TaxID=357466 RepID=A0AAD4SC82_9MAGN|nr:hypothetical protein MKW98_001830 [Papaver atlanticum]
MPIQQENHSQEGTETAGRVLFQNSVYEIGSGSGNVETGTTSSGDVNPPNQEHAMQPPEHGNPGPVPASLVPAHPPATARERNNRNYHPAGPARATRRQVAQERHRSRSGCQYGPHHA